MTMTLDGGNRRVLRLLEPQGYPDCIECDGRLYVPQETCERELDKSFSRGFISAVVSLHGEFPNLCEQAVKVLQCGGFWSFDDAAEVNPDDFDRDELREIYGVDADD